MTVRNYSALINHLVNWIKKEVDKRKGNSLFVGARDNINCALAALICKRTGVRIFAVQKLSDDGIEREELAFDQLAKEKNIKVISPKINFIHSENIDYIYDAYWQYLAEEKGALMVGSFDREEYNIERPYRRGIYDLMLLADLYKSEVTELYQVLTNEQGPPIFKSPTIKEWIDRENSKNNILKEKDPSKGKDWGRYTGQQRAAIAKAHSLNQANDWKWNPNLPLCQIRNTPGLVT